MKPRCVSLRALLAETASGINPGEVSGSAQYVPFGIAAHQGAQSRSRRRTRLMRVSRIGKASTSRRGLDCWCRACSPDKSFGGKPSSAPWPTRDDDFGMAGSRRRRAPTRLSVSTITLLRRARDHARRTETRRPCLRRFSTVRCSAPSWPHRSLTVVSRSITLMTIFLVLFGAVTPGRTGVLARVLTDPRDLLKCGPRRMGTSPVILCIDKKGPVRYANCGHSCRRPIGPRLNQKWEEFQ